MMIVAIDSGHGGPDPGAIAQSGERESAITLAVALLLERELDGHKVVMTRRTDNFATKLTTYDRAKVANEAGAQVFLSLHCNSTTDPAPHGLEVYHFGSKLSGKLAQAVYSRVYHLGSFNRGVKSARFVVLKHSECPACLVEMGFISNTEDLKLLKSTDYQLSMAKALALGLIAYTRAKEW